MLNLETLKARNAERRQRKAAASRGPWRYDAAKHVVHQHCDGNGMGWHIARVLMTSDLVTSDLLDECREQASVNGPFIAAARNDSVEDDVEALIAEVERLWDKLRDDGWHR